MDVPGSTLAVSQTDHDRDGVVAQSSTALVPTDTSSSTSSPTTANSNSSGPRATRKQVDELLKSKIGYYDQLLLKMHVHRQTGIDQRVASHMQNKQTNVDAYKIPERPKTPNDILPPKGSHNSVKGEKGLIFHSRDSHHNRHHRRSAGPAVDSEGSLTTSDGADNATTTATEGGGSGEQTITSSPSGSHHHKKRVYRNYNPMEDSSDEEVEMILDIKGQSEEKLSKREDRRVKELMNHFGDRYIPPERPAILEKNFSKDIWGHVEASKKRVALSRSGGKFDDNEFQTNRYQPKFLSTCDRREEAQGLAPPEFKRKVNDGRVSPTDRRGNRSTMLKRKNTLVANNLLQEKLPKTARARVSTTMLPPGVNAIPSSPAVESSTHDSSGTASPLMPSSSSRRGTSTTLPVKPLSSRMSSSLSPRKTTSTLSHSARGAPPPRGRSLSPPSGRTSATARRKSGTSPPKEVIVVEPPPPTTTDVPDSTTFALTSTNQEENGAVPYPSSSVSSDVDEHSDAEEHHQGGGGRRRQSEGTGLIPAPPSALARPNVGGGVPASKARKSTTFAFLPASSDDLTIRRESSSVVDVGGDRDAANTSVMSTASKFCAKTPLLPTAPNGGKRSSPSTRRGTTRSSPSRRSSSPNSPTRHPLLSMDSKVDEIFVGKGEPAVLAVGAEAKRTAAKAPSFTNSSTEQFAASSGTAGSNGNVAVTGSSLTARGIRFEVYAIRRMTLDSLQLTGGSGSSGRFATEVTIQPHSMLNHNVDAEEGVPASHTDPVKAPQPVKVFSGYVTLAGEGEKFKMAFGREVQLEPTQGATITVICERSIPGVGVTGGIACFSVDEAVVKSGAALEADSAVLVSFSHLLKMKDAYLKGPSLSASTQPLFESPNIGSPPPLTRSPQLSESPSLVGSMSSQMLQRGNSGESLTHQSQNNGGVVPPALAERTSSGSGGGNGSGGGGAANSGPTTNFNQIPQTSSKPASPIMSGLAGSPQFPPSPGGGGLFERQGSGQHLLTGSTSAAFSTDPNVTSKFQIEENCCGLGFLGTIGYTIVHHLRHEVPIPWTFTLTNPQITGVLHQDNDERPFSLHPPPEDMPLLRVMSGIIATNNDEFKRMVSYRQQNTDTRLKKCKHVLRKDVDVVCDYGGVIQHECFKRRFNDDTKRLYLHGAQEVNRWNHDRERVYVMKFRAMAGDASPDTMERALTRVRKTITDSLEAEFAAERESVKAVFWTKFKKQIVTRVKLTDDVQNLLKRLDAAFALDSSFGGDLLQDVILATPTDVLYNENIIAIIGSLGAGLLIPESHWHLPLREKTKFLITTKRMIELPDGSDAKLVLKIPPKEVGDNSLRWILHKGVGDVLNRDDLREFLRHIKYDRMRRIIATIDKEKLSVDVVDIIKRIQKHNIGER